MSALVAGASVAIASLAFAALAMMRLVEGTRLEERAVAALAQADAASAKMFGAVTLQRYYLSSGAAAVAESYASERAQALREIDELQSLVIDPGQKARVGRLAAVTRSLFALLDESMETRDLSGASSVMRPGFEGPIADASRGTREAVAEVVARQREILDERRELVRAANQMSTGLLALATVSVTLLLGATGALVLRFQRERDSALRSMSEAERRLALALAGSELAVWDWDLRTGEVYLSETWSRILGGPPGEVRVNARELATLAHPEDISGVQSALAALQERGRDSYRMEHRVRAADGEYRWILSRGKVVERDAAGRVLRVAGTNADITGRKRLERLREEFVSTVSHELRTPLTSIRAALALLATGDIVALPESAGRLVAIAHANCERLVMLINDILDFQRARAGRLQLRPEDHAAAGLARRACAAMEAYAGEHGISLQVHDADEGKKVHADADRFIQVLTNLISNAVKFSPPGGTVEVCVQPASGRVRFEICDRGSGVPKEFRPLLFQEFSQAEPVAGGVRRGTGLGLAIARALVEEMGGTIAYRPRDGGGSIFCIELPRGGPQDSVPLERG